MVLSEVSKLTPPPKARGRMRPSREGAGKTGCALHPRSHVQCASKRCAHEHTGSAETLRPSLRNGSTAYTCSPWRPGFLATIAPEKLSLLKDLTPASGRQDHTTSPYALAQLVNRASASTATRSNVRDDGRRPLFRNGMGTIS